MTTRPLVTAMTGVTISTTEPAQLNEILTDLMDWELCCEGDIDKDQERLWGIETGSAGNSYAVYRSRGATRGMIRVVGGIERERTRPIGCRWSGVEIVVTADLEGLYRSFDAHKHFKMIKAPLEADFSDVGANIHQAFYGRAPGGTHLMFTMAVTAARDYDFPTADARVGHIFDVPLVSDDFARSLGFYRDQLGMVPLLEDVLTEGIWHEAWDLPLGTRVDLAIIKGDAPDFGLGGIELQGYDGSFIDPIPVQTHRFDGGSCLTSYTSSDINATFNAIADSPDATVLSEPRAYAGAPYNGTSAFCFLGPGGERVEICENLWQA
ncbi:MAG: hypothetical protein V3R81_03905 [Gammaproteobacteria bacterium]